ncbi:MAG TPA: peptidylprolyl isomerase [Longimicrobiales bacterium]
MARQARAGDIVAVHYSGRLEDGTVFDTSRGGEPVEFQLGSGMVIDGVDRAVQGMAVGDRREIRVPPEEGYGPRRAELEVSVPRDQLPPGIDVQEGQVLAVEVAPGQQALARISGVDDHSVTLDLNHPLAGQTLIFDVELVDIRRAEE